MRFPKEIVAQIHEASPGSTTVRWPIGESAPQKNRTYWLLSEEDAAAAKEKADNRREHSPPTCREAMARMHKRAYGNWPEGFKLKPEKGPRKRPDACFEVLAIEPVGEKRWDVTIALHSDPDPIRHLHMNARVPAQPEPLGKHLGDRKVETEPEQIIVADSRSVREDKEDAYRLEHDVSVDTAEVRKWELRLENQRRRGKSGKLAREALERARRRASQTSAEVGV